MLGRFVPREVRVQHQRQKQIVPIVDDDELSAGPFLRGMVYEVFFRAVRTDVTLQGEFARDNFLNGDFLVPAVAAVFFFTAGLGDLLRATERAPRLGDRFARHSSIYNLQGTMSKGKMKGWNARRTPACAMSR